MPALVSNTVRSLLLLVAVWGVEALACPVCGQAKSEEVNATYVAMTAFMSLTPLALIFGVAAFVVHRIKKSEREAAAATPSGEGDPR